MTIVVENVKRVRLYEEPNGSFASDHTGTLGDYKDMPLVEGSVRMGLEQPTQSPMHLQQHIDGYPEDVLMVKRATLDFSIPLETLTTRPANSVTAGQGGLGRLLKIVMGGETLQTGTTVNDASATTTTIVLTSAAGLTKGGAIGFATGTGGALEIREIKNISTNTVTLKHALSNAPSNGSTCWAAATYSMGAVDGDAVTSAQFIVEGLEQDDRWLLLGGQLASPFTMEIGPGSLPRLTFSMQFANWIHGASTAATLTGAALGTSTYTHNNPVVVKDSEFRVCTNGTTSISSTLVDAPSITFAPNIAYGPHRTPAGVNTIAQWVRLRSAPVIAGTWTEPYEALTYWTSKTSKTDHAVLFQIGTSATDGGVLISAPTVQITDVQRVDIDGIAGYQASWKGRLDGDITSATTDVHKSAFRIHIM